MPIYLEIFNLIIDKKAVRERYTGGEAGFRKDYQIPASTVNLEDEELFLLGQMNAMFDIDSLVKKGLSYDHEKEYSDDFTIVPRYGNSFWDVSWLNHNRVFAWHKNTSNRNLEKVQEISNMPINSIDILIENGAKPFDTIWIKE